jgi:hypothetical protein
MFIKLTPDLLAVDLDHGVGADHREGDGLAKLLDLLLVVFVFIAETNQLS